MICPYYDQSLGLLNKGTLDRLHKNYAVGHHNEDWKKNNMGFGFLLYGLVRNVRAEKVLVVGSQKGYVPAVMALACKDEGNGKVVFVDASYDFREEDKERSGKSWGGLGIWDKLPDDFWEPLGIEDFIELNVMTTEEYCGMSEDLFDVIFIDGDHSYEGVKKDYELLWPKLKQGGLMIFHDILVDRETEWGKCGVKQFWDELDKKEFLVINYDVGMGVIRK